MELWHILHVITHMRESDALDHAAFGGGEYQASAARQFLRVGLHFTVMGPDGMPISCFGFNEESPQVATMWMISRDGIRAKSGVKFVRKILNEGVWPRVQAYVNPLDPVAIRFIEWIGLSLDGRLPGIRPGGGAMHLYSFTK